MKLFRFFLLLSIVHACSPASKGANCFVDDKQACSVVMNTTSVGCASIPCELQGPHPICRSNYGVRPKAIEIWHVAQLADGETHPNSRSYPTTLYPPVVCLEAEGCNVNQMCAVGGYCSGSGMFQDYTQSPFFRQKADGAFCQ